MSEQSYQHHLAIGLTGPQTLTCHPASFDRISSRHAISHSTYELYEGMMQTFHRDLSNRVSAFNWGRQQANNRYRHQLCRDLGVTSQIAEVHTFTAPDFDATLARFTLVQRRIGVVLNLESMLHMVGLIPAAANHYYVRSTSSPFDENEAVSSAAIFSYLDHTNRTGNIMALPAEH